ncbi:uncharacterized protein TNCT_599601 [Trichonephila clavata]|uniref:Uncharacterized protein n=1 Tax=Trichonephila clavata TaxID=2740835 RepID=A0A8X6HZ15_TRICU|nr:uncharacterized protein TNCT_599601 [Trichonephila clavata]
MPHQVDAIRKAQRDHTRCYYHCEPVPDTLSLQEFGTRSTSDATISSRLNASEPSGRNTRKGYHRLQGEGSDDITVLQQQPSTVTQPPTSYSRMSAHNPEECTTPSSGSSESSSDNEKDYFEGFTDTDDGKCSSFLDWYPYTCCILVGIFYIAVIPRLFVQEICNMETFVTWLTLVTFLMLETHFSSVNINLSITKPTKYKSIFDLRHIDSGGHLTSGSQFKSCAWDSLSLK